jgi:CheY-like chemotaxis protein
MTSTSTKRPVVIFPRTTPTEQSVKHRVLLVDDDDAVRDVMGATLERKAFDVVAAANVAEALVGRLGRSSATAKDSDASSSGSAMAHGGLRYSRGYTPAILVHESRILQVTLFGALQSNLSSLDFSLLLPDVMTIADDCGCAVDTDDGQLHERCAEGRGGVAAMKSKVPFNDPSPDPDQHPNEPRKSELFTARPKATFQWPPDYLWPFIDRGWDSET